MTKELRCRDLGFECDAVVTADSEDEILAQVADHGQKVHDLTKDQLSDPGFLDVARNQIHDRVESQ